MSENQDSSALANLPAITKPLVLVGLMGAGKTTIGRKLAARLGLRFVDADEEIERAAGQTVAQIFESLGEAEFRAGERRVISRLLEEAPVVVATGGGAFMDTDTRAHIHEKALSIWLKADLDLLEQRTARRTTRPLLNVENPRAVLAKLMEERYPTYAEADICVEAKDQPQMQTVNAIIEALALYFSEGSRG